MKAWVLHGVGDIRYEETDMPEPQNGEALVWVKAVGICGSDIPRIYKTGAYHHPLIPGHEFSGQVVKVCSSENEKWVGKRVGVFPLIPCRKCVPCKKKQYEMCKNYSYLGSRRNGGFAEYVAVPVQNLVGLPGNVSYETAAMLEPMAVAVHAIRKMDIKKTDNIAVCGLGTIGMFVVMFLREMGAENIFVVGNKGFQKSKIIELGINGGNYCDSENEDIGEWLKDKRIDVFFECVGRNETMVQAIENTVAGGKVMLVGNPYSDVNIEKHTYWKILRNQLSIYGTWNSSYTGECNDDWHYVVDRLKNSSINPSQFISHSFDLADLERGLHIMRDKSEEYIKIINIC